MFERFTERARKVVVLAQEEARHFNHNYVGTEHLLLGLLREDEGIAAKALDVCGVGLDAVRDEVKNYVGYGAVLSGHSPQAPLTPRSKKILELALREALQLGHNYIGTEHILLGLVRDGEGVATRVLKILLVEGEDIRKAVHHLLENGTGKGFSEIPLGIYKVALEDMKWRDQMGNSKNHVDDVPWSKPEKGSMKEIVESYYEIIGQSYVDRILKRPSLDTQEKLADGLIHLNELAEKIGNRLLVFEAALRDIDDHTDVALPQEVRNALYAGRAGK